MLTREQLDEVARIHNEMLNKSRSTPATGMKVECLGKEFVVYKNVFWPIEGSKILIKNFVINKGEHVLDVCTGSGIIAIFSAYKGAEKVVATDISPDAVRCAKENAKLHGFSDMIDVRLCDMFDAIKENEKFDVITGNLPFQNKKASDFVEASVWDTNFYTNKKFFADADKYLKSGGRIYLAQANFGALDEMKKLAKNAGFSIKLLGKKRMPKGDPRIFYALELRRKSYRW
jgi:release factor glutamine methyltransferase